MHRGASLGSVLAVCQGRYRRCEVSVKSQFEAKTRVAKTRVLVVDDDADARELIGLVLQQAGYDVDDAPDGFAALTKVAHSRPDLVVTDLHMPGMHGIDRPHQPMPDLLFAPSRFCRSIVNVGQSDRRQ